VLAMVAICGEGGDAAGQGPVIRSEDVADLGQVRRADAGAGLLEISVVVIAPVVVGDIPDRYREPGARRPDQAVDRRLVAVYRRRAAGSAVGRFAEVTEDIERQWLRGADAGRVEGGDGPVRL